MLRTWANLASSLVGAAKTGTGIKAGLVVGQPCRLNGR